MSNLKHTKAIIIFILFLSLLIVFDAFQQKYYVDQFQLSASRPISEFLISHLTRWLIWLIVSIPVIFYSWVKFNTTSTNGRFSYVNISLLSLLSLFLAFTLSAFVSLYTQNIPVSTISFAEFFTFFFYQKGITFLMAQMGLLLAIYSIRQSKKIDAQWIEIETLKADSNLEFKPQIIVKSGGLLKPLELENISWIQADDYCVKVHTNTQSYYLRRSLKFLESELADHGFIRVHRGALLNMKYVSDVCFASSKIVLKDNSEIPVSKSGEQILKRTWLKKAV